MTEKKILIGCVADDFTGASDAASFLEKSGLRTILVNGVPRGDVPRDGCDAVVIAMKTRSIPPEEAVEETLPALRWLRQMGTEQFYMKYCSTFDSTPEGNIGPVAEAAMEFLDVPYTVLCPSLPANGRTVRGGRLYVHGIPLDQSPMKDHPLNPMWDSYIPALMRGQSKYPCVISEDSAEKSTPQEAEKFYIVPDYETDEQGRQIAARWGHLRLLTGGSGLLEHLAARVRGRPKSSRGCTGTTGKGIVLCGSCSQTTREQIRHFRSCGGVSIAVDPWRLYTGEESLEQIWRFVSSREAPVLVYSIGAEQHQEERETAAFDAPKLVENAMAELGKRAIGDGFTRIIVAGGETSGAVMLALNMDAFYIGPSIAPGVPVMTPVGQCEKRIVLKSGNFGQIDFFARALSATLDRG